MAEVAATQSTPVDWWGLHADAFAGQRVLVTGGAGFIGSHLVEALSQLRAEVAVLDDLSTGRWQTLDALPGRPTVQRVAGSILEAGAVHEAMAGASYVFHLAALGSVPGSLADPDGYHEVNARGSLEVLQAARHAEVKRLVYAGSCSAYGDPADPEHIHENLPLSPLSPYAATKAAGELSCRAWSHGFGLSTAVMRFFNIFGPRQNPDSPYAAVIAAFAKALYLTGEPKIFGDGEQTRDFTPVANAVHAMLLAARCPQPLMGEAFNVGTGGQTTVNRLYELMAELSGRPELRPRYEPARGGEVRRSQADLTRSRRVLGYEPVQGFEAGLGETVRWYGRMYDAAAGQR